MDFHPIVVHFPIAFLTLYSILELLHRWNRQPFWKPLRAVLVIIGTIGAYTALQTGEFAEESFRASLLMPVLELHSLLANVTTIVFAILAGAYVIDLLSTKNVWERLKLVPQRARIFLERVAHIILRTPLTYILVIIALTTLSLVGALGGILVYGPDMDPVTKIVYWMFF